MFLDLIARFKQETLKSPWLAYTPALFLLIVTLYFLDVLLIAAEEQRSDYEQLDQQSKRLIDIQSVTNWDELIGTAEERYESIQERIWHVESLQLASADIYAHLVELSGDRFDSHRVTISEPTLLAGESYWLISAQIEGRLKEALALNYFIALNESQKLSIDEFSYSPAQRGRASITVNAVVKVVADV